MNKDIEHEVGSGGQNSYHKQGNTKNLERKKSTFQKQRFSLDESNFKKDVDISTDLKAILDMKEKKRNNYMFKDEDLVIVRSSKHFSNKNKLRTTSQ